MPARLHLSRNRILSFLSAIPCACPPAILAQEIPWGQAGAAMVSVPGLAGMVGEGATSSAALQAPAGFLVHPLFLNQGPFLVEALPDVRVDLGAGVRTFPLGNHFRSLEGLPLTFAIEGAGERLRWNVRADTLRLEDFLVAGVTHMVVSASDGVVSVADTFDLDVRSTTSVSRSNPASRRSIPREGSIEVRVLRAIGLQARTSAEPLLSAGVPGCDGACPVIAIDLPSPSQVEVSLFDNQGTPVLSSTIDAGRGPHAGLPWNASGNARILEIEWNGRAQNGEPAGSGVYLWKIAVRSEDGQSFETVRRLGLR